MKLRIKETGELLEDVKFIDTTLHKITIQYLDDGVLRECSIKNLSDIEEVKDYEEAKVFWYIEGDGDIHHIRTELCDELEIHTMKQIGNHFESKEEAEKAVEKLKAWKRLKDKGMIKYSFHREKRGIDLDFYTLTLLAPRDKDSLDLLFGGEE